MDEAEQRRIDAGNSMDLKWFRSFVGVAPELNFTQAAARLGMTQPPLSAAIGKLERELGVTLLERTSRPVTLNPGRCRATRAGADRGRVAGRQPLARWPASSARPSKSGQPHRAGEVLA